MKLFSKKTVLFVAMIMTMVLVFTACGDQGGNGGGTSSGGDSDVIKIGVFEPLTGANAAGGEIETDGIKLANSLYPEVLGKKVELVIVDNKSDKVEAANAVERLIDKEKVVAVIGSWGSSLSMAAGDALKTAKIPAVAPSATNPLVTLNNDYYFRVCFIDPFQGNVTANYAVNELGAKKAAIIQEVSNDYSVGLAKFFIDEFKALTGDENSIVGIYNYNTGDQDFSAQLTNVKFEQPDVIFAPGNFTESALIIKQAKSLGIDVPFLGGDTWETPEFIDIGGDAVEGAVFSTFFASEVAITDTSTVFLDEYAKSFNNEPAAVTALGFDAYLVILDAIERANSTDSVAIRDALAKTKDFSGAAGMITLDENGDAIKSAVIKTVSNGKFTYKSTVEPSK